MSFFISNLMFSRLWILLILILFCVFIYLQGGKIHVLVKRELVAQFSSFLGQGGSLMLINFSVTHSCGTYRTTNHPYRIGFLSTTHVRSCEKFPEDLAGFEPVKYTELFDGSLNPDYLVGTYWDRLNLSNVFYQYLWLIF